MTTLEKKINGCEHLEIIITAEAPEEYGSLRPELAGTYLGVCLDCGTSLLRTFENYRLTDKLHNNFYVIYRYDPALGLSNATD